VGEAMNGGPHLFGDWPAGDSLEEFPLGRNMVCRHGQRVWRPPTDVFECKDGWVIKMEICGLRKGPAGELLDAEIVTEKDTITIRGNRVDGTTYEKCAFHQMEIHYGFFELSLTLAQPFNSDEIHALYREGFLEIHVPKATEPPPSSQRVQVRS
jgi:HSP20 family protein